MGRKGAFCSVVRGGNARGGRGGHDVGDYIVDADRLPLGERAEGDLDLGHAVGIRVVSGVFAKFLGMVVVRFGSYDGLGLGEWGVAYGEDDVLLSCNLFLPHLLGQLSEVIVDLSHDHFRVFTRQDFIE